MLAGDFRSEKTACLDGFRRATVCHRLLDRAKQLLLERWNQAGSLAAQLLGIDVRRGVGLQCKPAERQQRQ